MSAREFHTVFIDEAVGTGETVAPATSFFHFFTLFGLHGAPK
jgi:hypothetical protein